MAKELTLEEALVEIKALKEENQALKAEIDSKNKEVMTLTKEVPGTFEYKGPEKELRGTYRIKKGCLTFILKGKKVQSEDIIKDVKIMTELVEDGFGLIEKV